MQEKESSNNQLTGEQESFKEKMSEMERRLEIISQIEELKQEGVFQYYLLNQIQSQTSVLKGIGQTLVEIGKILDESLTKPQKQAPMPQEQPKTAIPRPSARIEQPTEDDDEDEEEEQEYPTENPNPKDMRRFYRK